MRIPIYLSLLIYFTGCLASGNKEQQSDLVEVIKTKAIQLESPADLDKIIHGAGDRRLALLGESTHGTAEYYRWRAEISKRLIEEKNFSFIVVEGDWASIYRLNRYVKDLPNSGKTAKKVLKSFNRWPEWMWANTEVAELAEWLKAYNADKPENEKIGFYGMDVYGQWEAMDELISYIKEHAPDKLKEVKKNLNCFTAFGHDEWLYARAVAAGRESCEDNLAYVVEILAELSDELKKTNSKRFFNAKQNALVVKNAEDYYRLAVLGGTDSWNSRVYHMNSTVNRLLDFYGDDSKGIVWAHNTHVGDARATTMGQQNMVNIGNLARVEHGNDNVFIVGFGTYSGTVNAGSSWASPMQIMTIPNGMSGSYEEIFYNTGLENFYILFDENDRKNEEFLRTRGHRAIGVTYNPRNEMGNYVPTILPQRYDAFIFIKATSALKPVR